MCVYANCVRSSLGSNIYVFIFSFPRTNYFLLFFDTLQWSPVDMNDLFNTITMIICWKLLDIED